LHTTIGPTTVGVVGAIGRSTNGASATGYWTLFSGNRLRGAVDRSAEFGGDRYDELATPRGDDVI
jgi:hypothetical protein